MNQTSFSELGVAKPLCRALAECNYTAPTPIQARAIPHLLDGRDLLGVAQTGTGKTAAFVLPILQRLKAAPASGRGRGPRALVLAPTRELAIQIADSVRVYGRHMGLRHAVIFGGVSQHAQVAALSRGVDLLIATPGRLIDLMGQGHARLDGVEVLVLDEADRMLDMGFIRDMRRIVAALPKTRQSLLFSATMPDAIGRLAGDILRDPERVDIAPEAVAVDRIAQRVYFVPAPAKRALLARLMDDPALTRVIVFTRTKHRANHVAEHLGKAGVVTEAIHGNKSQGARQRALERFRKGSARVLVATDIAARGIDVTGVSHVINFELPNEPESYVHRIGRTARAGAGGTALSFCDPDEHAYLHAIERLTGIMLDVAEGERPAARASGPRPARGGNGRKAKPVPTPPAGNRPRRRKRAGGSSRARYAA